MELTQISQKNPDEFRTQWYTYVEEMISEEDRSCLFQHAVERSGTRSMSPDVRVPTAPAAYADPLMETLLEKLLPEIERVTERRLHPTYSYFRVYRAGDSLGRHRDRPACEISVSVNLGFSGPSPWPLWIEGPHGTRAVEMQPRGAVVYRGIDCTHWREKFPGDLAAQVFLHYVDQNGIRAEWKFDKRKRVGSIPEHPIAMAANIGPQFRPEQVELRFGPGQSETHLDAIKALIWGDLKAQHTVPAIVEHAVTEFGITEAEARATVMRFVFICQEKGLLMI